MLTQSIESIEKSLQEDVPGRCLSLNAKEIAEIVKFRIADFEAVWKLEVQNDFISHKDVNELYIAIDSNFPTSQPYIFAPDAFNDYAWPHVEKDGLLCLKETLSSLDPSERVIQHLIWAQELLNFSNEECNKEFRREFTAYWGQKSNNNLRGFELALSLVTLTAEPREVVWCRDLPNNRIVFADDLPSLMSWFENLQINKNKKNIHKCWFHWVDKPWLPSEFPKIGVDLYNYVPDDFISNQLESDSLFPVVFGTETETGRVVAATFLATQVTRKLKRKPKHVQQNTVNSRQSKYTNKQIHRYQALRVDGAWIHGRDNDATYGYTSKKKVVIVGCGSLGASIAELLTASGIGNLILIDDDTLNPPNLAKHTLGISYLKRNKAEGVAEYIKKKYPHIKSVLSINSQFQKLKKPQLKSIENSDLIISCGVSFEGDIAIDKWRLSANNPLPHICSWTEEYAIVGHAIALLGEDSIKEAFNTNDQVKFLLTEWPEESKSLLTEAGCGNVFQPQGAVDINPTITLTSRFALDVLLSKVPNSIRRVWLGDQSVVTKNGGTVTPFFTDNLCVKEYPWPSNDI